MTDKQKEPEEGTDPLETIDPPFANVRSTLLRSRDMVNYLLLLMMTPVRPVGEDVCWQTIVSPMVAVGVLNTVLLYLRTTVKAVKTLQNAYEEQHNLLFRDDDANWSDKDRRTKNRRIAELEDEVQSLRCEIEEAKELLGPGGDDTLLGRVDETVTLLEEAEKFLRTMVCRRQKLSSDPVSKSSTIPKWLKQQRDQAALLCEKISRRE